MLTRIATSTHNDISGVRKSLGLCNLLGVGWVDEKFSDAYFAKFAAWKAESGEAELLEENNYREDQVPRRIALSFLARPLMVG